MLLPDMVTLGQPICNSLSLHFLLRCQVIERTANGLFAAALQSVGVVRGPKGLFQTDSFIDGAGD
jgi:hypothetical protein